MRTRRARTLLPLLAASALIVAACGDDDDDSTSEDTAADTAADAEGDAAAEGDAEADAEATGDLEGTLRVLVHQNPPMVEFMENFNAEFEEVNPGVSVDMSVVNADDLPTVNQTRLQANDIDVTTVTITGFDKPLQPYMTDAEPPAWQTLIEAGLLMDLTGQPFLDNYDDAAIEEGGSFDGGVYSVNLGRVTYSGMFANLDLLSEVGIEVPETWDELVAACDAVTEAGYECMTAGGADAWPVHVGAYGILGALYPDQEGLVEGLWTGDAAWNDEQGVELFTRYQTYTGMLEDQAAGLGHDAAIERYKAGDVAFAPTGNWQAGAMEPAEGSDIPPAEFEWTYVPFPGGDTPEENQTLYGKYDQGLAIAADTPVEDIALAYLGALSEPETYNAFANAVNFLPTQPTATLDSTLGQAVAPILEAGNFKVGFEQWIVYPKNSGQYATGELSPQWFYSGDCSDPAGCADRSQADLEAGL